MNRTAGRRPGLFRSRTGATGLTFSRSLFIVAVVTVVYLLFAVNSAYRHEAMAEAAFARELTRLDLKMKAAHDAGKADRLKEFIISQGSELNRHMFSRRRLEIYQELLETLDDYRILLELHPRYPDTIPAAHWEGRGVALRYEEFRRLPEKPVSFDTPILECEIAETLARNFARLKQ